jgi:hypothetical protein
MNRRQKPTYNVALILNQRGENITVRAVIENTSEIVGEKVSVILLVPEALVGGPKLMGFGPQMVEEIPYLGVPGDKMTTLSPFTKSGISFRNFPIRLPNPEEGRRFTVIARVYDEHGQAVEATFTITREGCKVTPVNFRAREKVFY